MEEVILILALMEIVVTLLSIPSIFFPISKKINNKKYIEISLLMILIKGLIAAYLVYSVNVILIVLDAFLVLPIFGILIKYYVTGMSK